MLRKHFNFNLLNIFPARYFSLTNLIQQREQSEHKMPCVFVFVHRAFCNSDKLLSDL